MIIPESTINKIRDEADIVKIISEYIKLEKKSSNFVGICPFHPDQNPSLSVSPSKKIYKCFSCNASGNVITFVQNYEKVSFPKAVQIVGEKCGIKIDIKEDENSQNLSKYYKILESSTNFYQFLLENTVDGQNARNYLYKRNLTDEIIKRFKIGLSSNDADLLYQSLLKEKIQPLDMIEAGVVRNLNSYIDVFRNRIMFPLDDINGNIVGFSGRIYSNSNKDEPKYINSSDNIIFKKGNILYNFSNAQSSIRQKDQVFIFEGFMDVIAAYKANVFNAVATMGTSLTINQIKAIKKHTSNVVICYDGDNPGIEASKKAILMLLKEEINVKAVLIPDQLDPDEYIDKYGVNKLNSYLNNSQLSGYDYLYEATIRNLNINDLNSIEKFKNEIFNLMHYFKSNVLNEKYLIKLSNDLKVSIDGLKADFANNNSDNIISNIYPEKKVVHISRELPDFVVTKSRKIIKAKYANAEKTLIKIAFHDKNDCKYIISELDNHFVDINRNNILVQIKDYYNKNEYMNTNQFMNTLNQDEIENLQTILDFSLYDFRVINKDELISTVKKYKSEISIEKTKDEVVKAIQEDNLEEIKNSATKFKKEKRKNIKIKTKE